MARHRHDLRERLVTIEVGRSLLRLVIVERHTADHPAEVTTREVRWPEESTSLHSEAGVRELTTAVKRLVAEEKLAGANVRLTLSGDHCVTRVLTGPHDRVRREMAQLESRSQLYLSLGPGHKAMAGSIRQIDARHQHALLCVSNQKTLDALIRVATAVGIQISLVEPSLVALCRLLGQLGHDQDAPTMIVNQYEKGVELGISYQGQLLLDYRPGGSAVKLDLDDILAQHLARLKRYCQRYFRFAAGELKTVYLAGDDAFLAQMGPDLDHLASLDVKAIDLCQLQPDWQFTPTVPSNQLAAAMGTALLPEAEQSESTGPNLMEDFLAHVKQPLIRGLLRVAWPAAAALVLITGMLAVVARKGSDVSALEKQVEALAPLQARSRELRLSLSEVQAKHQHLTRILAGVEVLNWDRLIATLTGCLPDDVWLEQYTLHGDHEIRLSGASYSEDGVFEFVSWLEKVPGLSDVALEGTKPGRFGSGSTTVFQLKCKLADPAKFAGGSDRDG